MTRRFAGWEFSTRDAHGSHTWLAPLGFAGSRFSYRVGVLLRLPRGRQLVAFHYRYAKNLERRPAHTTTDPELLAVLERLVRGVHGAREELTQLRWIADRVTDWYLPTGHDEAASECRSAENYYPLKKSGDDQ